MGSVPPYVPLSTRSTPGNQPTHVYWYLALASGPMSLDHPTETLPREPGREILPPYRRASGHPTFVKWHLFSLTLLSRQRGAVFPFLGAGSRSQGEALILAEFHPTPFGGVSPMAGDASRGPLSGKGLGGGGCLCSYAGRVAHTQGAREDGSSTRVQISSPAFASAVTSDTSPAWEPQGPHV